MLLLVRHDKYSEERRCCWGRRGDECLMSLVLVRHDKFREERRCCWGDECIMLLLLARHEMYSEERRENMVSQVSSLHQHSSQSSSQVVSQETAEWQEMARKEKTHVEYAESSHFSMVSKHVKNYFFCGPKSGVTDPRLHVK